MSPCRGKEAGAISDQKKGTSRKKRRVSLSTIIIVAGLALILAGGGIFAAGYPWMQLLYRLGWTEIPDDLPDPDPLPEGLLIPADSGPDRDSRELDSLFQDQTSQRPPVYMTWLGVVKLPRIGISENIVEGTGDEMLYAVGHSPGSAALGGEGNCVLAAHRNYIHMNPFRHLDQLEIGDTVLVEDEAYRYRYQVDQIFEVGPEDNWVMEPQEGESHLLTLLTCTPVANPVNRLIVWCRLTDVEEIA